MEYLLLFEYFLLKTRTKLFLKSKKKMCTYLCLRQDWLRAEKNVHAGQILKDKLTLLSLVFLCLFVC